MKRVREHIDGHAQAFAGKPLFTYLRNESIEPRRRLTFIPSLAHFVMTFSDLYAFVLPREPPGDRFQELVNIHVSEDVTHWRWFLADLTNADLDPTMHFTDALRFIWSRQTVKTRMLSYEMCRLAAGMDSVQRLILVSCIEATGSVALEAVAVAGRALEPALKRKLVYFGSHHVDTESEHTLEDQDVRRSLEEVFLADTDRQKLLDIVEQAFRHFGDFVDEIYQLAQSGEAYAGLTG